MNGGGGDTKYPRMILPPLWVRGLLVLLSAILLATGVLVWTARPGAWGISAGMIALGAVMSVRLPRAGIVLLDADRLRVRGVFSSLTIARRSVVKVAMPFIEWTDRKGEWRQALVFAFAGGGGPDEDVPNSRLRRVVDAEVHAWLSDPATRLHTRPS